MEMKVEGFQDLFRLPLPLLRFSVGFPLRRYVRTITTCATRES